MRNVWFSLLLTLNYRINVPQDFENHHRTRSVKDAGAIVRRATIPAVVQQLERKTILGQEIFSDDEVTVCFNTNSQVRI